MQKVIIYKTEYETLKCNAFVMGNTYHNIPTCKRNKWKSFGDGTCRFI